MVQLGYNWEQQIPILFLGSHWPWPQHWTYGLWWGGALLLLGSHWPWPQQAARTDEAEACIIHGMW